jgi:DnaJ homologue, subfamily C, member 28, conserved domain
VGSDIFSKLAEEKIKQATERGDFDDLPGKGQPLELEDDSRVPEELRLAYKVLKNAGYTPPELDIKNEMVRVEDMLANAPDEKTRYQALKRLNYLTLKLSALRPQSGMFQENAYSDRVAERLTRPPGGAKKD